MSRSIPDALPSSRAHATLTRLAPVALSALVACQGDPGLTSATGETGTSTTSGTATGDAPTTGPGTTAEPPTTGPGTSSTTDAVTGPDTTSTSGPEPTTSAGTSTSDSSTSTSDSTTSTSTSDSSTSTSDSSTTADPCPPGTLGCPCLEGQVCEDMLECTGDVCVEPPAPLCGDGVLDPGEACDDGNQVDGDGCEATCAWTPCAYVWQKTYVEPGISRLGNRVATDADGNIVVVGIRNPGQIDKRIFAMKLDPAGALLWTDVAVDLRSEGLGVAVTDDGAVIAVGTDISTGFTHDVARRFAPDGTPGWLDYKLAPGYAQNYATAVAPDGGVIFAGYRFTQSANIPWLARVDAVSGALEWGGATQIGGATSGAHLGVTVDASGNIFTTGEVKYGTWSELLIRKFDPGGAQLWIKSVPNPDTGYARGWDIEATATGGVAVTGEFFYGNGGKTGADVWVGVYDGDGNLLWSDLHDSGPGQTFDTGYGVAVGPQGHVHVAGIVDPDLFDGLYRKYDAAGNLLCSLVIHPGDPTSTTIRDVAIDPDGFPIVTGITGNNFYVAKLTP